MESRKMKGYSEGAKGGEIKKNARRSDDTIVVERTEVRVRHLTRG